MFFCARINASGKGSLVDTKDTGECEIPLANNDQMVAGAWHMANGFMAKRTWTGRSFLQSSRSKKRKHCNEGNFSAVIFLSLGGFALPSLAGHKNRV